MKPRALLVPPGFPDFLTRKRIVERGRVELTGRAWSGTGAIARVELGLGDERWLPATVHDPVGPYAWRRWTCAWDAGPGDHVLSCRATDATGIVQPTEQAWNYSGAGNNMVQRVPVTVR